MSVAISGHGALIATEADPVVAGTFVTIAELNGPIMHAELTRTATEVTPHQDTIDSYVFGVQKRAALTFSVNWIFNGVSQDHLTGLMAHMLGNQTFGLRITGSSSGAGVGVDEIIMSGQLTSVGGAEYPVREGEVTSSFTYQPSGLFIIDTVVQGTLG